LPFCRPEILNERPIRSVSDLKEHTFLHVALYASGWPEWLALAGAPELQPARSVTFEDAYVAIQGAIDGLGIIIAPVAFVVDDLAEGRLVAPFSEPVLTMSQPTLPTAGGADTTLPWIGYHAYVNDERFHDPTIIRFIDWLQAIA
jgi:LysR family glycine cleavage system transcriptional activator